MSIVSIVDHKRDWHFEFLRIAAEIRKQVGSQPKRIDHIGSTSIAGLAAKDVIDIQVSVDDLSSETVSSILADSGYRLLEGATDNLVGIAPGTKDLQKHFLTEPEGERRINLHIREEGRTNQRYPLLFRDFLGQHPPILQAYQSIKVELAKRFPDDLDAYYAIKDPYMDTVYLAALQWAEVVSWNPDNDFR